MNEKTADTQTTKKRGLSNLLLLMTAILWGSGFIAQRLGSDNITPFTFNGFRFLLAGITFLVIAKFRLPKDRESQKIIFWSGVVLFAGSTFQQLGMRYTSIGNTGFITTIYVSLVPFLSYVIFRERVTRQAFLAAIIAMIGLYLISTAGKGLENMSIGDMIVFIGSFFWATHILIVAKAKKIPAAQFTSGQFLVAAVLNLTCWVIFDGASTTNLLKIAPAIAYSGIFVVGLGFTLQAVGQKNANSAEAAIILGTESVFAMIFGAIIYHESFNLSQAIGAVLIFLSVVFSVLSGKRETVPEFHE